LRTGQLAELRAVVAEERLRAATDAANASEAARLETKRRTVAHDEVIHEAQNKSRAAGLGAAAARVAGDGLHIRAAALAARCDPASGDTAAAQGGPPADTTSVVLAGLLDSLINEALQNAAIATKRGIAGQACERAYDSLNGPYQISIPGIPDN
jgi:hypothetical protein